MYDIHRSYGNDKERESPHAHNSKLTKGENMLGLVFLITFFVSGIIVAIIDYIGFEDMIKKYDRIYRKNMLH